MMVTWRELITAKMLPHGESWEDVHGVEVLQN